MNLLHDVPLGDKAPKSFHCVIEIPKGSHNKYEIDKETGLIKLDRANYGGAPFPFDYGFAPQTYWDDGDALDVIVLSTYPIAVGVLVDVRPVALLEMTDGGESDFKIISVPTKDKRWDDVHDLSDLNAHALREYTNFFETYKMLKGKSPTNHGVEVHGYKGKKEAVAAVERAIEMYRKQKS
jgi:inorganic pyrophosphatase